MIIWMLLGQILYTSVLSAHTIANQEKQSILQSLVKRQVLYDDSISIDSVIAWSEQLLPTQQSNEDRTTYFLLQLQLANAYTLRGDISLATNRAQLMELQQPVMMVLLSLPKVNAGGCSLLSLQHGI